MVLYKKHIEVGHDKINESGKTRRFLEEGRLKRLLGSTVLRQTDNFYDVALSLKIPLEMMSFNIRLVIATGD